MATGTTLRAALLSLSPCLLAAHLWLCIRAYPVGDPERPVPFMQNDHTFHFYYAWLAARAGRPNASTYDAYFMAGYAKTLLFPTSSTYAELLGWLFPKRVAFAYKLYVLTAAWLVPVLLALAGLIAVPRAAVLPAILAWGVAWFWGAFPATYVDWGMVSFVLTSAMTVLGSVALCRWLSQGGWPWWLVGTAVLAVAQIGHPSTAVTAASLLAVPFTRAAVRRRSLRRALALVATPLVVLALWSPWWVPTWICREQLRSLATGFINENFLGRMLELVQARFPLETALLVASAGTLALLTRRDRDLVWLAVGGWVLLFGLGYGAAASRTLGWLQAGRYTQPLYAWLVVWSGIGLALAYDGRMGWLVRCVWLGCQFVAIGLAAFGIVGQATRLGQPRLSDEVPRAVAAVCRELRGCPPEQGRVLFEELERRDQAYRWLSRPVDPYGGTNPAAYVVTRTGHQLIGGPYLYTHLKQNYVQFGDGRLCGRRLDEVDADWFWQLAARYNVRWLVTWSGPMVRLAESRPDRFHRLLDVDGVRLYELVRSSNWAVEGYARCRVWPGRIDVFDVRPAGRNRVVLSFHWSPGLWSTARLVPVRVGEDPVPFIGVEDPPEQFLIRWGSP